ncbi:class II fumarate hydratase [Desemzia sp. RIT804]|uniref:class II fumarate hydratase n=1 Tax=Desemzia sp. RIT 804 TaxID=2810209 RepID=UPI00194FFACA|nr:class II fumarate hydratase [Desemzia sp. RIT 804]MBM6613542.1 class II fumarate hydratase [Desemzia sp. RIT 804]
MQGYRQEKDALGIVQVKEENLWGAQTQRSLENFDIGTEKMPLEFIYSFVRIKKAAAIVNHNEKRLAGEEKHRIIEACNQILNGKFDDQFPLKVWQTGSGTQTNMNVNEVIAAIANQSRELPKLHPNDHINASQSSNDVFPTAMQMTIYQSIQNKLLMECQEWVTLLKEKEQQYQTLIKIGRTHLQDAVPMTFGQEISGWRTMLEKNAQFIEESSKSLKKLPIGGTAVGTGLNAPDHFDQQIVDELNKTLGFSFEVEENKFYGLSSHSNLAYSHGALRSLATDLMKIANDIRWLASGPRGGLGEILIPANEPGSSIMPGKVNPTQAEALTMIVAQVMGNDATVQFAASQGNFQLNVFKPVILFNMLQSIQLLSEGMRSFRINCLAGMQANEVQMEKYLKDSLMIVTALSPKIGYEKSAQIAKFAYTQQLSIRDAALQLELASKEELDRWLDPKWMIHKR